MWWLFGPPGIGKSRCARDHASIHQSGGIDSESIFTKSGGSKWWDGYAGESVVIWDEPDLDIEFGQLLQLCDHYELRVEVKGSFVRFIAKLIIFTSKFHLETLFAKHANYAAFSRRITLLLECEGAIYEDMKNF